MRSHRTVGSLVVSLLLWAGIGVGCSSEAPDPGDREHVTGELLVRYHKDVAEADEDALLSRHELTRLHRHARIRVDRVAVREGRDVASAVAKLREDPGVLYAEPNYLLRACALPNDIRPDQWFLANDGGYGTPGADIGVREAWDISTGDSHVVVAVVDTGVEWTHPDLEDNIWTNVDEVSGNGVDDDHNGFVDDVHGWDFYSWDRDPDDWDGHGTHVAGAIGAVGNNGKGVVGVTWDVRIMPLRFMGYGTGSLSDAAAAIEYAVDNGAHVINGSFGSYGWSNTLRDAISAAADAGVLFVAAAGNEDNDNDTYPFYPASYDLPNVVSVAASDGHDKVTSFTNYGDQTVHLAAPGESIYSTWINGGYGWLSGTSMASPVVAGAAALALSVDPAIAPSTMKELLMETAAHPQGVQGWTVSDGRLDAAALLQRVDDHGGGGSPPPGGGTPPDAGWTFVPLEVSSAHPYVDDAEEYEVIEHPGAGELRVHFAWLETEQGYDHVHLTDWAGAPYASYTGRLGEFVSDPIPDDRVVLWLVSDASVQDFGYKVEGYSWR